MIFLSVYPVGFVDVVIGFDRVRLSIESRSSPPSIVNIISLRFLLSPLFSIKLCNFRRSHDIDLVDRYSDFAISLTITGNVGGLEGFIGIDHIIGNVGVLGTVGGVPIFGNVIGEVESPNVGVGEVTVLFAEIVLPKVPSRANGVGTLELVIMSFDASAAVTLIEIMLSGCSGVVGNSTTASCLSTPVDVASEEEEVAGNDPGTGPLFRLLLRRIDESLSIVKST